jgi:hypothetical protein
MLQVDRVEPPFEIAQGFHGRRGSFLAQAFIFATKVFELVQDAL